TIHLSNKLLWLFIPRNCFSRTSHQPTCTKPWTFLFVHRTYVYLSNSHTLICIRNHTDIENVRKCDNSGRASILLK
uniref:Ovule protein n=1 Tax=Parascaris univalens TaxID=6257 RepID=A0A914ZFZ7_PARUN